MIDNKKVVSISKFLSLVLRHKPETIGLELDEAGWTNVDALIQKLNQNGKTIDFKILEEVVKTNNKKRFAFNEDKTQIRASQGHSIEIDHGFEAMAPPDVLFHGTAAKNVDSILQSGLDKRNRHHVHLSADLETALMVGKRHGKPVIFEVAALKMHEEGMPFYKSENAVWLTELVPAKYLLLKEN